MNRTLRELQEERLNRMEAAFEAANIRMGECVWNIYSGEGEADLDAAQAGLSSVLGNASDRAMVEGWLSDPLSDQDRMLARRLRVWCNCLHGSGVDNDPEIYPLKNRLQKRIASFTFRIGGRDVKRSELQKILRNETDRETRRQAWLASAALARANSEDLRRLIELRNDRARRLGYRGYVDLLFHVQEVDTGWLFSVLDGLLNACRPAYSALMDDLARRIAVARPAPWDVAFAMRIGFQLPDRYFPSDQALERLRRTAGGLGFAVEELPIRTLVRDIPFGGYNVAVKIPRDSRFLVNPSEGHTFYTTAFHEYGHSLHAVFTRTEWPILKEYEWVTGGHTPAYSEGMAEVMGEFARRPEWLERTAGVPGEETERYMTGHLPAQMMVRLFDLLLNLRIELSAYDDPSQDMAARERELNAEIRLLDYPREDPPQWEANTWYTSYPVYWQNYILASVIACQIHAALTDRFGPSLLSCPDVAAFLRTHFYERGNSLPWTERIEQGTGRGLSTDAYLRRVISPRAGP